MRQTAAAANTSGAASTILLLVLAASVVFIALTNRRFLWINGERAALITLVVLGMAMCTRGIGRVAETGAWTSPLAIAAYILGAAILAITVWISIGKSFPFIAGARTALIVVAALIGTKLLVSTIHSLLA